MAVEAMTRDEPARVRALKALNILDTPREERYDRVVRIAQEVFGVKAVAVNLIDADRQFTKAEVGLDGLVNTARCDSMCTHTVEDDTVLVVADAAHDDRFTTHAFTTGPVRWRFYAGHPVHAPGGEPVGALCLVDDHPRVLDGRERHLLAEMAGWVERELADRHEMDQAAHIQRMLLPSTTPDLPGYELAARFVPARDLGGDFYDWYRLGEQLQVHVADVMGKGTPAALVAASVRAVLHGASRYNDQQETINRVGAATERMLEDTATFVTCFSARLDPAGHTVNYVDAGHGLAVIFDPAGGHRRLSSSGPPLGVLPGTTWIAHTEILAPGETLVVISDGFLDYFPDDTTAIIAAARLKTTVSTPQEFVDRATAFACERGLQDDITVVVLHRRP